MTFGISVHFGFENRTFRYGVCVRVANQAGGAPFIDTSTTIVRSSESNEEIARYKGVSILLQPWKRNQYGEYLPQKSLVIAKQV